jgi:hypothetical protein
LTPEQREILDGWLFDERVSQKLVLGWAHDDFGVEASLTSLKNYYQRRVRERSDENLELAMVEAKLTAGKVENGEVKRAATQLVEERILRMLVSDFTDLESTEKIVKMLTRLQSAEIQEKRLEIAREGIKLRMAEKCLKAEPGAVLIRIEQGSKGGNADQNQQQGVFDGELATEEAAPGKAEETVGPPESA